MPSYLSNVYLLSAVASVTFGVIGSFVVARRIGYLSGAISHCAFGGVGIGLWLQQAIQEGAFGILALVGLFVAPGEGPAACKTLAQYINPVMAALIFAVLAALLVDWIRRHAKEREETLLGAVWSIGMAVGLLFLSAVRDQAQTPATFLFGDVLLVRDLDVVLTTILSGGVLLAVFLNFKKLEAVCFDEEYALLRGVNVGRQNRLLLTLTAITIVLMLRVVGMAMIVALITLPAATASRFTKKLSSMIVGAIAVCFFASWAGITISYVADVSTGPTIVLVVAALYGGALLLSAALRNIKKREIEA